MVSEQRFFSNLNSTGSKLFKKGVAKKFYVILLLALVLLVSLVVFTVPDFSSNEVFVGVMAGHETVDELLVFIDEVEEYVNLIVVSELAITTNSTKLYDVFDYLYAKEIYFMPFMEHHNYVDDPNFFRVAEERWGKYFLGVYTFDEPGGKQIDAASHRPFDEAQNNTDAVSKYLTAVAEEGLVAFAENFNDYGVFNVFTSDYALFWYDYLACYNVVFAELGWNNTRQLQIALCRGAATGHNSDWGAIMTWTYRQPPYIESPEELYNDMILAYNNGATYILVFNYPTNQTEFGLFTREHLEAMYDFWNYIQKNPQPKQNVEVAYLLPKDYGFGFRGPEDNIWGLWGPDELSPKIWNDSTNLLETYTSQLDIIYETASPSVLKKYKELLFWNGTTRING
ncbi:hypothetical protein AC477_05630 [miscellaneous Crenarchaeota group-1 archaeon SG8-32-1]|uniref:Uncharacterized protein n=1 Tax=miscellaneous Crenarchaeota group-1 archaeon SG8-32-1 TaxID=1685124 RepID=A0A0M0BM94_9ARCH|nr:MAG: hypothetical protein AC477_05630 [miscellaneous Crenarchaeota group-1 archaeon SG8-32-1]